MFAGGETVEIVAALGIAGRPERKCPDSAGGHGIVVFFARLDILSKLRAAVHAKVNV